MAGSMLGAAASIALGATAPAVPSLYRTPASTRTRRLHGVCLSGALLLGVYSSRRASASPAEAVCIAVHEAGAERLRHLSIGQARTLALSIRHAVAAGTGLRRAAVGLSVHGLAGEHLAQLPSTRARALAQAIEAAADAAGEVFNLEG